MQTEAIVAGHICLDIIPTFLQRGGHASELIEPGKLIKMGPAVISTGGAVSNTGLALHRLGIRTKLMGKVGDDVIGRATLDFINGVSPGLTESMIVAKGEASSYSIVINPPGIDRTFLHSTGPNDTFTAADVSDEQLRGARLFHFGYPTLMQRIHNDGGETMADIFQRARRHGLATSLDMSYPDPKSPAGQEDWPAWLKKVLPHVDMYLPSLNETQFMLRTQAGPSEIAKKLHDWGAKIIGLKLGDKGLFVRWPDRELSTSCFQVNVAGTTGSGDATIAGFLAGWLRGLPPEETMTMAVAVGACCCEAADATTGIRPWEEVRQRITSGWQRKS